jgi:hypothetical protein
MKTALWPTQVMLYQRLSSDVDLNAKITGVYDEVSSTAVFPYVTIGEQVVNPFKTKNSYGENIVWTLHCWSDYSGKKETYDILSLMLQALSKSPLIVDGFALFNAELEDMQVITDIDGSKKHGILQIRFYVNH